MALSSNILESKSFEIIDRPCSLTLTSTELCWEYSSQDFADKLQHVPDDTQNSLSLKSQRSQSKKNKSKKSGVTLLKVEDNNLQKVFDGTRTQRVKLNEVIGVKTSNKQTVNSPHKYASAPTKQNSLSIFVVRRAKRHRWRTRKITFNSADITLVQLWADHINSIIKSKDFGRPKSVIVFINPVGGKKQAPEIFRQKVAPYLDMAGIHCDVIMTQRANHARDHILECDLSNCDGLISVGGDGMFTEILHGIMARTYREHGLDGPKAGAELLRPSIKLGIIPAGSTDTVIWSLQGCSDPSTAALHIAIGDTLPMDVATVHNGEEFIKYNVSLLGYGYYGDVLIDSEKNRWMGPRRYDWAGLKKFLTHRVYMGELLYVPSPNESSHARDKNICKIGCSVCTSVTNQLDLDKKKGIMPGDDVPEEEWRSIQGRFIAINTFLISCRCRFSEDGPSPYAHLGDGSIDMVVVHECSRTTYFKHLYRCTQHGKDQFALSGIDVLRVKAFKFRPQNDDSESLSSSSSSSRNTRESQQSLKRSSSYQRDSTWNCDGEIVDEPGIDVRAHAQVVQMFARGIEEEIFEDVGSSSCIQSAAEKD